jgi:hypothetical protein
LLRHLRREGERAIELLADMIEHIKASLEAQASAGA